MLAWRWGGGESPQGPATSGASGTCRGDVSSYRPKGTDTGSDIFRGQMATRTATPSTVQVYLDDRIATTATLVKSKISATEEYKNMDKLLNSIQRAFRISCSRPTVFYYDAFRLVYESLPNFHFLRVSKRCRFSWSFRFGSEMVFGKCKHGC